MADTNKKDEAPKEEGPHSFSRFLAELGDGDAEGEISYQLHELGKRLQEHAHARGDKVKGALTLKFGFVAEPSGVVGIAYDIVVKEPKRRLAPAVMWLTKGGNLSPFNPKQQKLPLREVSVRPDEVRDVEDDEPAEAREA